MAAVTIGTLHPVNVVEAKIGKAAAALTAGKPVVIDGAAAVDQRYACTYKAAVAETTVHGIVLKDAIAGGPVEVLCRGEIEGYTGLTTGAPLSVAGGNIDTTAPAGGAPIQLIAIGTTRIWVKL